MEMTDTEIARAYQGAKNRKKQIGILANLNDCPKGEIVKALQRCGLLEPPPAPMSDDEWIRAKLEYLDMTEREILLLDARIAKLKRRMDECKTEKKKLEMVYVNTAKVVKTGRVKRRAKE